VAEATGEKARHIRERGLDNHYLPADKLFVINASVIFGFFMRLFPLQAGRNHEQVP